MRQGKTKVLGYKQQVKYKARYSKRVQKHYQGHPKLTVRQCGTLLSAPDLEPDALVQFLALSLTNNSLQKQEKCSLNWLRGKWQIRNIFYTKYKKQTYLEWKRLFHTFCGATSIRVHIAIHIHTCYEPLFQPVMITYQQSGPGLGTWGTKAGKGSLVGLIFGGRDRQ